MGDNGEVLCGGYKLKGRGKEQIHEFEGSTTNSPAASACAAINTQDWLKTAFGDAQHVEREIAKEVFGVKKHPAGQTIAFVIKSCRRLPPRHIQIFRHNPPPKHIKSSPNPPELLSEQHIGELYTEIEASWEPHHKRKRRKSARVNESDSAKPPTLPKAIAGDSYQPANWVRKQREQDLSLAKELLTAIDAKIQTRQWESAAGQCLTAEKLFSDAHCVSGVVECRVKLCAIHSELGWKVENLDWLLETVKLVVDQGGPWQIGELLSKLSYYLPEALFEHSAKELVSRPRQQNLWAVCGSGSFPNV